MIEATIISWIVLKINCFIWRKLIIYNGSRMIISRSMPLKIRNISDKIWRENQNKYFMFSKFYFIFFENRTFYEIIWKNKTGTNTTHVTIWIMRIACWVPKATNTHSEYVILIAFPRQQWFSERTAILRYTYIVRLGTHLNLVAQTSGHTHTHTFLHVLLTVHPSIIL